MVLSPNNLLGDAQLGQNKKGEECMRKNLYYNGSGYSDPTAGEGIKEAVKQTEEIDKKAKDLVYICKYILGNAGFELNNRIEIKHKATGRVYKQEVLGT